MLITLASCAGSEYERPLKYEGRWLENQVFQDRGAFDTFYGENIPFDLNAIKHFASWSGGDSNTGSIVSPTFTAPSSLTFYLAGTPNSTDGNSFALENEEGEKYEFPVTENHYFGNWERMTFDIPKKYIGKKVRLTAVDKSTGPGGWIGFTEPLKVALLTYYLHHLPFPIYIFLLILLTFFPALIVNFYRKKHNYLAILKTDFFDIGYLLIFTAIFGYVSFYVYCLSHNLGKGFVYLVYLSSLIGVGYAISKSKDQLKTYFLNRNLLVPFTLFFAVVCCYISIVELVNISINERFLWKLPFDNIIPKIIAEAYYEGFYITEVGAGWLVSDRPPLQVGMLLSSMPFWSESKSYLYLGTIYQCFWVLSVWVFCKALQLNKFNTAYIFLALIFTGFFLQNSTFTWPKLLATSFTILAVSIIVKLLQGAIVNRYTFPIIFTCLALAYLSHGGVAFNFPILGLILIYIALKQKVLKPFLWSLIIPILYLIPWSIFKAIVAPPGNRLLKMHFGGVGEVDERGTIETIIDAYSKLSWEEIIGVRLTNIKALLHLENLLSFEHTVASQFYNTFNTLGFFNLGILLLPIIFFKINKKDRKVYGMFITLTFFSLLTWILLMFGANTCIVHQGSYLTIFILFFLAAKSLLDLNKVLAIIILTLNIAYFFYFWVLLTPRSGYLMDTFEQVDYTSLIILIASCFILLWLLFRMINSQYRHITKP